MLDIQFIRQNADQVRAAIKNKGLDLDLDDLLAADRERREATTELEQKRARKNELSARHPEGQQGRAAEARRRGEAGPRRDRAARAQARPRSQRRFQDLMLRVPSIPRPEVPVGKGEEDNVEVRRVGEPRKFDFTPKDHVELMTALGIVEWDGPRRFAGRRSYALVGDGALLEMAVLRLAVDTLVERGLKLVSPPVMVKERAMTGTGFFPLGREEAYSIPADELFLIGTSEVPLVSMHCDDDARRGAPPAQVRGHLALLPPRGGRARQGHARPLPRAPVHEGRAGRLLRARRGGRREAALRAPRQRRGDPREARDPVPRRDRVHRRDRPRADAQARGRIVDAGRGAYSETHSCSTLGDFQARRSNIRVRTADGTLAYPYTLNNTAIASPRILIPLLENHQNADGSVTLPKALVPYMNGRTHLGRL